MVKDSKTIEVLGRLRELENKLLAFGGRKLAIPNSERVQRGFPPEPYLDVLLSDRMQYWSSACIKELLPGRPRQCHRNASRLYITHHPRFEIVHGYALADRAWGEDDAWESHSWLIERSQGDAILETSYRYHAYAGVVLDPLEAAVFAMHNSTSGEAFGKLLDRLPEFLFQDDRLFAAARNRLAKTKSQFNRQQWFGLISSLVHPLDDEPKCSSPSKSKEAAR